MKFDAKKLPWKSLCLTALVLTSCASVPDIHPHFVDTDLNECREYDVVNKDEWIIKFKKSWPIEHCNGYFSMPQEDAARLKEYYLQQRKQKQ